jgi:translocation and assembly module TamB
MFCARGTLRRSFGRWQFVRRSPRTGGARRRLLVFLVLVAGAIALLPYVVARTPLRSVFLSAVVPSGVARISVDDASLSWFRPPLLTGIEIKDGAGNLLLVAEKFSLDRGPLQLIMNRRELGMITVHRPTVYVQTRPDGSNLEDVARKLLSEKTNEADDPHDPARNTPPAFALNLSDGTILIEDLATSRQWRVHDVNAQYDTRGSDVGYGRGSLSAQIIETHQRGAPEIPAGRLSFSLRPTDAGREELDFQADALSLATLEPWLRRLVVASELSGTLSGKGTAAWNTGAGFPTGLATAGTLAVDRLDAAAPALMGDRMRLLRVEMPWRISAQADGFSIEELQLRSEIGQVAIRGRLDNDLAAARHDLELRGSINGARLAAMLPHALRIRPDTTITSGTVELAGRYRPGGDGQHVSGSVRTTELAATNAGRVLRWDEPISANFEARRTGTSLQIDTLRCDSKFLKIDARGSWEEFSATASFDLNSLAEQLGQFVDLNGMRLAGTGTANLNWQQASGDQFTATVTGDLAQLAVSRRDGGIWSEPQLSLRADAAGLLDPVSREPSRVESAQLQVSGQGDELDARLVAAVSLTDNEAAWPVSISARGGIARWLTRARPVFTAEPWHIDGQSELTATLRIAANAVEASGTKLVVNNLRAAAPGWNINESRVELTGDARWNEANHEFSAGTAQLVTSTVSIATRDVQYRADAAGINQLAGTAAFRADLARLAAWRAGGDVPPEYRPSGELTGNARFVQQAGRMSAELSADGQNLVLAGRAAPAPTSRAAPAPGYQTIWQEPKLTLRGQAHYDVPTDRLTVQQLQLDSATLQASIDGDIQKLGSAAAVNLNGTLNYDLAKVAPLLRPYIGSGIQLAGREQARFAIAGNLTDQAGPRAQLIGTTIGDPYGAAARASAPTVHWSRAVRAQLEFPWSGANVYGLPVGPGKLTASLGEGSLRVEPLALSVGEGRLTAAPVVRLDPQPAELTMPAGPLFTNVRISPEVSEAMLKFVAPVLAGATQSEGQFSMQLDGTRIPLGELKRADAAGRLTVHSVRVVPGALARELIGVGQQIEALAKRRDPTGLSKKPQVTLLVIRDQQVNFRVVEGRVHHQNMEFQVGDVTLRSQGSVGLDETLALTLHVPIQDAWVAKEPLLAGLKGQSLQVPVSGTLTRPKLDQRAIASLSGQLIQNAAGQAVGNELNKALDKLFKSR